MDCNSAVAPRCTIPSATKRMPLGDINRVLVLSRIRNRRDALWVLSERRSINSVGAVYTEPAISRTSGGTHGGISKTLINVSSFNITT